MFKIPKPGAERTDQKKLAIGDQAPHFILPDQDNRPVHFADLLGNGPVVLFFYPKDFSPGCTAEVCAFRDSYETFNDAGATVIGVSADTSESHRDFADRHRLPFILLSDTDGRVQALYGVEKAFGILRGRVTFIIDRNGVVRHTFSSQLNIDKHIMDALSVVQSLQSEAERAGAAQA